MCTALDTNLDDSLDDFLSDFGRKALPAGVPATDLPLPTAPAVHYDTCASCRGSGKFVSYAGRVVGPCFKCKGEGKIAFATSAPVRAAARQAVATKKAVDANAWMEAHPAEAKWMVNTRFDFAIQMVAVVAKYGYLTEGQLTAVQRLMARDDIRAEENANRRDTAKAITVEAIEEAFARATDKGVKSPKLRLGTFKFAPAKAHSANAGAIYVNEGEDYLGKVVGGKFLRTRACTDDQEARIIAAATDPAGAAKEYGHRTGACCICHRELTDPASIAAGIGPICAGNYGF